MHVQGFIGFRIMWSIRKFYDLCIPVFINNLFIYIAKKEDVIICFSFFFFFWVRCYNLEDWTQSLGSFQWILKINDKVRGIN